MKVCHLLLFLIPAILVLGFSGIGKDDWTNLFNGRDLQGWDTYLGPPLDSSGKKLSDAPVGLNHDPKHIFTVVQQDGEPVIRISGDGFGAISTKGVYDNFHLQLKFKWGNLTWGQKKNKKKDSGLLYFSVGEQGADNGAWMRSQEFQIEEGNCGEYWGCAGGSEDITAFRKSDSEYIYQPGAPLTTFNANSKAGRHCKKALDGENTSGEWNLVDLYCLNGTSVHEMNGRVMMVLTNSRQMDQGILKPLTSGKLQIQSEGAEVFYKDIRIMSITEIPENLLK